MTIDDKTIKAIEHGEPVSLISHGRLEDGRAFLVAPNAIWEHLFSAISSQAATTKCEYCEHFLESVTLAMGFVRVR